VAYNGRICRANGNYRGAVRVTFGEGTFGAGTFGAPVAPPIPAEHGAPPWWTEFVLLEVQLGIGTTVNENVVGRWDTAQWDDAASGTWSGLEPVWRTVDPCALLDVNIDRGRSRALERFGASSASVTADDASGWLSWSADVQPSQLPVRPGTELRIRATLLPTGDAQPLWRGFVETVDDAFAPSDRPAAKLTCQDALAQLAHIDPLETDPPVGAGERSDERIGRLLDIADWPDEWRDLDVGLITVQATNLARNIVDDIGITADSEGGAAFADRDGNVAFRNRDWLRARAFAQTVQASIGGRESDVCGAGYEMTLSGADILNDIQLGRAGGTMRRYVDTGSISLYRQRTFNRSDYVCETDAQIDVLGNRMLNVRSDATARVPTLTIQATDDIETWAFVLAVDYGWRILVTYTPADELARGGVAGWSREMHVQGVSHQITPAGWQTTLRVDDAWATAADTWDNAASAWDNANWSEVA
jgi:hypothetical protein